MKIEDMWKEIFKDDPEGYVRFLNKREENIRNEEQEKKKKIENIVKFFSSDDEHIKEQMKQLSLPELLTYAYSLERQKNAWNSLYKEREGVLIPTKKTVRKVEYKNIVELYRLDDEISEHEFIGQLSNEQIQNINQDLYTLMERFLAEYHQKMEEDVFSKSHTTLGEIIKRYKWQDIRDTFCEVYAELKHLEDDYETVYNELLMLEAIQDKDYHVITLTLEDGHWYEVSAVKPLVPEHYAIEYCQWEEWLGFRCNQNNLDELGEVSFIAHCLGEMTFCGVEQETIQRSAKNLAIRVQELEETNEKEG